MWFKLKEFRESKKLYQSDMARIMQSNQSSISRNELRPAAPLTFLQYELLCKEFGKDDVDAFVTDENAPIIIKGNKNVGNGTQTNKVTIPDKYKERSG